MKIYIIGIKGSGCAALAHILKNDGHLIEGKDVTYPLLNDEELIHHGIKIHPSNDQSYLQKDLVIIGHNFYHQELIDELLAHEIIFFEYHQFLDFYLKRENLISICGSHGKTTLVNLLSLLNPCSSYLRGDGTGGRNPHEDYFFLESCEYQNHFLSYYPSEIMITNIDYDHVDYFPTRQAYENSFKEFVLHSKKVYISYSDRNKINHDNIITYGLNKNATFHGKIIYSDQDIYEVEVSHFNHKLFNVTLLNYGKKFVELCLGVIAFNIEHNLPLNLVLFQQYIPAKKRFETLKVNQNILIFDYAHHPAQIKNNFQIVKEKYPHLIHIGIFKGDRESRVNHFFLPIQKALADFDLSFYLPCVENNRLRFDNEKLIFLEKLNDLELYLDKTKKYSLSLMSSKHHLDESEYLINLFNF
jgi:UDP-N-acetylmuramate--alanine ligase